MYDVIVVVRHFMFTPPRPHYRSKDVLVPTREEIVSDVAPAVKRYVISVCNVPIAMHDVIIAMYDVITVVRDVIAVNGVIV